jgi:HEAT repeat protein
MTINARFRRVAILLLAAAVLFTPSMLLAQDEMASPEGKPVKELWDDFLHYIKIARPELAQSFGQAILDSNVPPNEIYLLSVNTPGSSAVLARGSRQEGMQEIILQLQKIIEQGYEDERSDPEQIAHAIEMLGGTVRGYEIAARRLEKSGEYVLPQLIQKLTDSQTSETLRERIIVVLPRLGKDAVRPLTAALSSDDSKLLEILVQTLGEIRYPHAVPAMKELSERQGVLPRVKEAAERAIRACGGEAAMSQSVSSLYYDQALSYYYNQDSVAPDSRYNTANVWYWVAGQGLTYSIVPREIFGDIYAMRMARNALKYDEKFYPAISLWIAANLQRASKLAPGQLDPTYGEDTPSVQYYALASGAEYLQEVLARALKDHDSPVARGAIEALAKTAGAKNLVKPISGGAQPLVQALSYPDRNVRFMAAVSLAGALPQDRFSGDEQVMSQLITALHQTGQKRAVLIVADEELRNAAKDAIRGAGFEVIDQKDPDTAIAEAYKSAGVDVAVLASSPSPISVISKLRESPAFVTLPVVVIGHTESIRPLAAKDGRILTIDREQVAGIAATLEQAINIDADVAMDADQATQWAIRAANLLEKLGETETRVFSLDLAVPALIAALNDDREELRLAAARALSVLPSPQAQNALAAIAVSQAESEDLRITLFGNLSSSLRRFGNQLDEKRTQEILSIVNGQGSQALLDAAAQVSGAMNLPSDQVKTLILKTNN